MNSLLNIYKNKIIEKKYNHDDAQINLIKCLDNTYKVFLHDKYLLKNIFIRFLNKTFNKKNFFELNKYNLYIWGGVGRGKTWIMDLFYQNLPTKRKMRFHFHHFMIDIHRKMNNLSGNPNPLKIISNNIKKKLDIICFDEFFIHDIANAMLFSRIIKYFLKFKIILIITSNIPPNDLYKNGLQRSRFISTIKLINKNYTIFNLDSGIDYRLKNSTFLKIWISPISFKTKKIFLKLLGIKKYVKKNYNILINNRLIKSLRIVNKKIPVFDFKDLCIKPLDQSDYFILSKKFNIIFIYNVSQINEYQEDVGKRFLFLVDSLYDNKVKLVVLSSVVISNIYVGKLLKFEYKRCISRLHEMQSKKYFLSSNLS
ncbi:yhcM [Wigglesworthia glossinidia endosymbiont of Glossina brevipalpis]|uniref:YhcM protein n=1 Tax=Wigglesworthia glossinidia brevipalpis TaxID=36870 RepID=Q8D360_WIGBR|nr:yhcM [Wigglesworthia glossinidia endosymbiont of Glossina brevipalpis]